MEDLTKLLTDLLKLQRQQNEEQRQQMEKLIVQLAPSLGEHTLTANSSSAATIPKFEPFDSLTELWKDYWDRFQTFARANCVPADRLPQIFLTNQTASTYKLLSTLVAQQTPPKEINDLFMTDIPAFMENQFDPRSFIVRERFKIWSEMQRKPGDSIQELVGRIRQDAAKCDFSSIQDPQDEAMRTRFICSVNNEAVLKSLFKIPDAQLSFSKAIQVALEIEDAAKVAKETIYGPAKDSDPQYEAMRTRFICSVNNVAVLKSLIKIPDLSARPFKSL
ncbi:hypothetical protein J437_LFUL007696 [Ladona fulva]|uniref:Uncharacterized protein n=1 Tax=Ladona fulva TaxID=123851 RepID=A0A8K0NYY0_LADFU|nr:hypothetical protein J437_LFUL007696 [Ladona fulva]